METPVRVTLLVPAFNEQGHLAITVGESIKVFEEIHEDYEILIINDGSLDRTGEIAEELSRTNARVRVVHNERNRGYGFTCQRGLKEARGRYVGYISADTSWDPAALKAIIAKLGETDIITVYTMDMGDRTWLRRFISGSFTGLMNMVFGLNIRYYNGPCFHKIDLIRPLHLYSTGLTLWAEILIRLVKSGHSYQEMRAHFEERKSGETKAFKVKNIAGTLRIIFILIREVYFSKNKTKAV